MSETITIRNESEAYEVLRRVLDEGLILEEGSVTLDGWPNLKIHLTGDQFDQTMTPTVMRSFIDLQQSVYRSYALSKYGAVDTRKLTASERESLEIAVKVSPGSSDYDVNLQSLMETFITSLVGKMDPQSLLIMILTFGTLIAGTVAYKAYLQNRKEIRLKEIDAQTVQKSFEAQREALVALQYVSQQDTEKIEIMSRLALTSPLVDNIQRIAYDAATSIVKAAGTADSIEVAGVSLSGSIAQELTTNARRKSEEIRLDGNYRVTKIDSSNPSILIVKIRNISTQTVLDARVQDESLSTSNRQSLSDALLSRHAVALQINAKEKNGELHSAIIIGVTPIEPLEAV